jgi:hypothetical protein
VISGDDEGAFGWLALNYQQGRLRPHSHSAATAAAGRGAAPASITSLGGLDLGGSSLQITFEVPPAAAPSSGSGSTKQGHSGAAAPAPPEYNISAAGHTFHLHLHSFKQYGLNEAYDRSITYLLQQQQEQQQLQKQQQNLEHEAQAAVEQVAQQAASTAAGNGTEAAGSTAPPAKPALSDSSSSGNASSGQPPAGLVDEQWQDAAAVGAAIQQHDLAVARAAGVPAADDADAAAGGDPAVHASSGDTQPAADVEHQRQVDLAAAAAAGFHHAPDAPEDALSTTADKDLDSLELSSSDARSTEHGLVPPSSSDGDASGLSSSTLQGSSSHAGLQPVARHSRSAPPHGADHWPVAQQDSSEGLASPGLRLQGRQQQQQPSAAAARRRASGRLRRSLMQQQLLWLDQLLGSAPQQLGSSSNSGRPGSGARSTLTVMSVQQQQQQQQQHSHDIRLRQLLTDYLLHDNLGPPPSVVSAANISSTEGSDNDSLAAARHPGRASSSRAAPLAAVQGHAAPLNSRSSSGNSSSKLQVVQHPCLHEGYEAAYTRLAFEGVTPEPAEVGGCCCICLLAATVTPLIQI